jgi:hypothetical protein
VKTVVAEEAKDAKAVPKAETHKEKEAPKAAEPHKAAPKPAEPAMKPAPAPK